MPASPPSPASATAAQSAGPKLAAADPLLTELAATGSAAVPVGNSLSSLFDTFIRTKGFESLGDFIYNTSGAINGFDSFGHFLRTSVQVTNCIDVSAILIQGCEAFFQAADRAQAQKKKKKKKKRARRAAPAQGCRPPRPRPPHLNSRSPRSTLPPLDELIPADRTTRNPRPQPEPTEPDSSHGRGHEAGPGLPPLPPRERRMRGGRVGTLAASPTLVGAVTVLVVVVAVFLSYQANQGLPFVPTYKLSAELPNANTLVPGNEVRIGGARVGQIKEIEPISQEDGSVSAKVDMELNQENLDPLPEDSTVIVRARSALGLKYLEIQRGDSSQGFGAGETIPLSAARPEPVDIDQVFNTFDEPTRAAIQTNLLEFGNALAGRGVSLNATIGELRPLVERLEPVMRNLASPDTGLSQFVSALSATAAEAAPVAEIQGQLFVDLETTFRAFADVARPFIQETISKAPETEDVAIDTLPRIRPFLANTARFFGELRPGFHAFAPVSKQAAQAVAIGVKALRDLAPVQRPARSDRAVAAQPQQRSGLARGRPRPHHLQQRPLAAALLHHPGSVGLQLRDDPLPEPRQHGQLRRRPGDQPARGRPPGADRAERRGRPQLRAPAAAAMTRTTSFTTTRTRTPPHRGRSASARPATRSTAPARSRSGTCRGTREP